MATRWFRAFRMLAVGVLTAGLLLADTGTVAAASRTVRLEAGAHTGYRFSASGAIVSRKTISLSGPSSTGTDRRRVVPTRSGIWMRVTRGSLAGYELLESPVAYIPGIAGDTAYAKASVTFTAGRYLGYRFDAAWDLASTRLGSVSRTSTASSSRRAVIDGRPYVLISTGIWAGTWMPVTVSRGRTAQKLTCSVPARPAAGAAAIHRVLPTDESKVALTFDLGGRLTPAVDIMERLIIDRVCATIFPTGDAALTTTGQAIMALVKAHPELFEVGNHTMHHCNLRDGGGPAICPKAPPTAARIAAELKRAEETVQGLVGRTTKPYWRPPYGAHDSRVRAVTTANGYTKTIMWDVDTIDWRPIQDGGPTARAIADKVVTNVERGSIVLMHLGGYHTYDGLPSMVLRLRANGLQPSTISDILD